MTASRDTQPLRTGILGAATLLGKEIAEAVRERGLSSRSPRLLQLAPAATPAASASASAAEVRRGLLAFDDEPALLEDLTPEVAEELDLLLLAGSPEDARRAWEMVSRLHGGGGAPLVIDAAGILSGDPAARLAGSPRTLAEPAARLLTIAHPAAQAVAGMLRALGRAGSLQTVVATVFEPASERGMAGLQALEQQTVRMLSLQGQGESVFDAQVAFNLRAGLGAEARPSLEQVRERIVAETHRLLPEAGAHAAITLLQAPLFHASVISLFADFAAPRPSAETIRAAFESCGERFAWNEEYPDAIAAANQDEIQLGPVRAEADPPGGSWLFATLDNLRQSAIGAVEAARETLRAGGETRRA